jgi:Bacterial capsule synthesis protein PGA_cap
MQFSYKVFVAIIVLFLSIPTGTWIFLSSLPNPQTQPQISKAPNQSSSQISNQSAQALETQITNISYRTLNFGNVFWGRYIDDWSAGRVATKDSKRDYSYPFSGLSTFDKSKYNAWFAGLECPITDNFVSSFDQDNNLKFNCLPGYVSEAKKWFDGFTLANNHIDNMEEFEGYKSTQKILDDNGIRHFGHYDNSKLDDVCKVLIMNANGSSSDSSAITKVQIPVAYCGYHNVFKLPTTKELNQISIYSKYFPTIVFPHQGAEYTAKPDSLKIETYRKMLDLGADVVIGDHPHTIQSTEMYLGNFANPKLIVYSLGNAIFDQQSGPLVTEAIALDMNININAIQNDIPKFLELAKSQNPLQEAQRLNSPKPILNIQYDIIPTDNSGKLLKKSTNLNHKYLITTNWKVASRNLSE